MGTLGPAELLVILLVALIVLGPERLPDAARKVGNFIGEIRRMGAGFQAELRDAMTVPTPPATGAPPGPSPDVDVAPPPPARPDDAGDALQ